MKILKVKCWYVPNIGFDAIQLQQEPPTLELIKKSMLKNGYRAFCLTDRSNIENSDWYRNYITNDKVLFYIEGSGLFKLVNIDLVENEFYFEKSNLPTGYRPWIFFSWQSDYNPSRGHIRDAIEGAIEQINNRNPRSPIELVESTRSEDGAGDIVDVIKRNIDRSLYCVFDITNVAQVEVGEQNVKAVPNPNVCYELGYALSRKNDNQVALVKRERPDFEIDTTPFDFDQRRRFSYSTAGEVGANLTRAIVEYFEAQGFI